MRHDAGTSGALLWQLDKREVLGIEHTSINSHLSQGACDGSQCKANIALRLATSHLRIYHVIVHGVKAQQIGRHLTIQWERRAIACSRTKGITVRHLIRRLQEQHIIGQRLGISAKPQSER